MPKIDEKEIAKNLSRLQSARRLMFQRTDMILAASVGIVSIIVANALLDLSAWGYAFGWKAVQFSLLGLAGYYGLKHLIDRIKWRMKRM